MMIVTTSVISENTSASDLGQCVARALVRLAAAGRAAGHHRDHERAGQRDRPATVSQGKCSFISSLPLDRPAAGRRPAAPRPRTWTGRRTGRTRSALAHPSRRAADRGGERVDQPVHAPVVEVHRQPGQPLAGPHQQRLVDRVAVQLLAGGHGDGAARPGRSTGTGRRPYIAQARTPTPTTASTRATVPAMVNTPCELGRRRPTTGARKSASRSLRIRNAPAPDRADREQDHRRGHHRRRPRAGAHPRSQRRSPAKVMNITRVM